MTDYYEYNWRRIGAVIAVAALIGVAVWYFLIRDDDSQESDLPGVVVATEVEPFGPAFAGGGDLKDAAAQVGHPIYWAGKDEEGEIEFTLSADGRAFVRYLTDGASPGDTAADFLTVATYQVENAEAALQDVAGREGRVAFEVPGGGIGVSDAAQPQRVYFTPAGSDLQIEVFDPEAGRARTLVESGQIEPAD